MDREPIFSGRSAEIFDAGEGWILKRPKAGFELVVELEANNYRLLDGLGLPMPKFGGVGDGGRCLPTCGGCVGAARLIALP